MDPNFLNSNLFLISLLWTLPWKGLALWKAAKNGSKIWFIVLLVINTFGILEIAYYFLFSRQDINWKFWQSKSEESKKPVLQVTKKAGKESK